MRTILISLIISFLAAETAWSAANCQHSQSWQCQAHHSTASQGSQTGGGIATTGHTTDPATSNPHLGTAGGNNQQPVAIQTPVLKPTATPSQVPQPMAVPPKQPMAVPQQVPQPMAVPPKQPMAVPQQVPQPMAVPPKQPMAVPQQVPQPMAVPPKQPMAVPQQVPQPMAVPPKQPMAVPQQVPQPMAVPPKQPMAVPQQVPQPMAVPPKQPMAVPQQVPQPMAIPSKQPTAIPHVVPTPAHVHVPTPQTKLPSVGTRPVVSTTAPITTGGGTVGLPGTGVPKVPQPVTLPHKPVVQPTRPYIVQVPGKSKPSTTHNRPPTNATHHIVPVKTGGGFQQQPFSGELWQQQVVEPGIQNSQVEIYRSNDAEEVLYKDVLPMDKSGFHLTVFGIRPPNYSDAR
jgi:hypothetical protein